MDLNETTKEVLNRHPWELSRTKCVLNQFARYLGNMDKMAVYANIGAGDLYFDMTLLKRYTKHRIYAVDIAYKNLESGDGRIHKYHFFEEIPQKSIDYAIMMDSLEYMERDVAYVKKISREIKSGGYFFLHFRHSPFSFPIMT